MKLATFVADGQERFGIVLTHPATGQPWVFDPEAAEQRLYRYASGGTSGYFVSRPRFLEARPWPRELAAFLALGEAGLTAARRLEDYLRRFLEQADQYLLVGAGYPVEAVRLRAPIPRPRLYFGLVQNSGSFVRHAPQWRVFNLYPKGHQRPQGAVVGPGEAVVMPRGGLPWGFNVELGVIIGQGGREIPIDAAMRHVAGYTVVIDVCGSNYIKETGSLDTIALTDFFASSTEDWPSKKSDTLCPMGPYLVTRDEVGNPYDLLVYTRQSGWLRDRSHTAAMFLGVERLIHWYSSFASLYPGDVLHMGTMGVDGLACDEATRFGPGDYIEAEIEKLGVLRNPVVIVDHAGGDWRAEQDAGRAVHPAPAVRDVLKAGAAALSGPAAWRVEQARHLWTVFANYAAVEQIEGAPLLKHPCFLNGPASALSRSPARLEIPPRARTLHAGPELAFVVRKLATRVAEADADDYILGYLAAASFCDLSSREELDRVSNYLDWGLPEVYGRWADGFSVVSEAVRVIPADQVRGREMVLRPPGVGEVRGNTDEYVHLAPRVLEFITRGITLFPGDVVTLGRVAGRLPIAADQPVSPGASGEAGVEGVGSVVFEVKDRRLSSRMAL